MDILSVSQVYTKAFEWNTLSVFVCIVLGLVTLLIFVGGVYLSIDSGDDYCFVVSFLTTVGICATIVATIMVGTVETNEYKNEYRVVIDDTVSFNDIIKDYELINQDGRIYIIRDKEVSIDASH